MKRKFCLALLLASTCFSLPAKETSEQRSMDGKYIIRQDVYQQGDPQYQTTISTTYTVTLTGEIVSALLLFNSRIQEERDLFSQEEIYGSSQSVEKYIMSYTKAYTERSGIDRHIEYIGPNNELLYVEYYYKNKLILKEKDFEKEERFPFYRLEYLKNLMYEGFIDKPGEKNYLFSARYQSGRSFVRFIGAPVDMDETDLDYVKTYFSSLDRKQFISLYHKKVLVEENGRQYYIMFQDSLLQHITAGGRAAVYYYHGVVDDRFQILAIGFTDL